ncbi:MAG TPA: hypothetical protein PKG95_02770 [Anaerolineaceae bacterium]|nr:hypothetical protein [Anaerolineaceae bacterium]
MNYEHRFRVKASQSRVWEFHRQAASMAAITPPPVCVKFRRPSAAALEDGDVLDFVLWIGPLPVRWLAGIGDVSEAGFSDRQIQGPFAEWLHRHTFTAVDDQTTEVVDAIALKLKARPLEWLVGMGMWLGLPFLFAYRGWKTRRILTKRLSKGSSI